MHLKGGDIKVSRLSGKAPGGRRRAYAWICGLTAIMVFGVCGCGAKEAPSGTVAGTVTLGERALDQGAVVFYASDGVPAGSANVSPSGEFRMDRPISVGEYRVAIVPPEADAPAGADDEKRDQALKKIPQQYWSHVSSGFTASVTEGENSFTFEMR